MDRRTVSHRRRRHWDPDMLMPTTRVNTRAHVHTHTHTHSPRHQCPSDTDACPGWTPSPPLCPHVKQKFSKTVCANHFLSMLFSFMFKKVSHNPLIDFCPCYGPPVPLFTQPGEDPVGMEEGESRTFS